MASSLILSLASEALILLVFIRITVSESSFACKSSTVIPQDGLPFYEVLSMSATYREAESECRSRGAELLTLKNTDQLVLTDPARMWLAARRSSWKHVSRDVGLLLPVSGETSGDISEACVLATGSGRQPALTNAPCSELHIVLCATEDLALCAGNVFGERCYFLLDYNASFFDAGDKCKQQSAFLADIRTNDELEFLTTLSQKPIWTGYEHTNTSSEFFWNDGSPVSGSNWKTGQNASTGDCLIINNTGEWEVTDCEKEFNVTCVLDAAYADRSDVSCSSFGDECLCLWSRDERKSFHGAMAACMEDGGTLFYPNSDKKLAHVEEIVTFDKYWVGISDGHTVGLFRGSDSSAIEWAKWSPSEFDSELNCVTIEEGEFVLAKCTDLLPFICQSRPDTKLYPCTMERGCLGAYGFWKIKQYDKGYLASTDIVIQNIKALEKCWEACINYIGYICLRITYNHKSGDCRLSEVNSETISTRSDLLTRIRQRTSIDPKSYCLAIVEEKVTAYESTKTCASYNEGWKVVVITDSVMNGIVAKLGGTTVWISANMTMPGVYKTFTGQYIPYSKFSSDRSSDIYCVVTKHTQWREANCSDKNPVACFARLADLCASYPNVSHSDVHVDNVTGNILYTCEDQYFLEQLNSKSYLLECNCEGYKNWMDLNCTAIPCPIPEPTSQSTMIEVYGHKINDTILYQAPRGQQVANTGFIYYNLTCTWVPGTLTAVWSDHPTFAAINCSIDTALTNAMYRAENVSLGAVAQVVCLEGYRVQNQTTNITDITCILNDKGTAAVWSPLPHCEAITCQEPEIISNSFIDDFPNTLVPGAVTKYQCNENFTVYKDGVQQEESEVFTTTCEINYNTFTGRWTNDYTCGVPRCHEPPTMANGSLIYNSTTIYSVVNYTCDTNYIVATTRSKWTTSECQMVQNQIIPQWTTADKCTAIQCGEEPNIPNAELVASTRSVGSFAQYTCNHGYNVIDGEQATGPFQLECLLDNTMISAHWSQAPTCEAIECGEEPNIPNAQLIASTRSVGSFAQYTCNHGYNVIDGEQATGLFQLECLLDNTMISAHWSQAPTCEVTLCPEPVPIANGQVTAEGYRIGDMATYTCDSGYKISNVDGVIGLVISLESVCVLDATDGAIWKPIPTCIRETVVEKENPIIRQCVPPGDIVGATVSYKDTYIGSPITYVGYSGYTFREGGRSRSVVCLPTAQWSMKVKSAKRNFCPPIEVKGATKSTENTESGTKVIISCKHPEAKMENGLSKVKIKCTDLGRWSYIPKSCQVNRCGPFDVVERAHIVSFNNTVGGLTVLMCHSSSRFSDGQKFNSFQCLSNLTWEQHGLCLVNTCPVLNVPLNSKLSTNVVLEATVVEVTCLPGYMFPDKSRIKYVTCNSTFQWNVTLPDCEALTCPEPPQTKNGNTTTVQTVYNSTITYTCDLPYRLEYGYTELTIRCEEDGKWTHSSLSCDLGRCQPVPEVRNAEPNTRLATNGTTLVYTCITGYVFSKNITNLAVYCDGVKWNITETSCNKVTCPELNLTHATWSGAGNSYGDLVTFTCDEGHHHHGNTTGVLECQANSQWSEDPKVCRPVECGSPPEIKYSTKNVRTENIYGVVVTYECLPNYWIKQGITNTSVFCTKYGEWTNVTGLCTLITCPPVPIWEDVVANTTNNVVGTTLNISCSTDDVVNQFVISHCTSNGEWQPPLDICPVKKAVIFNPAPEEAEASASIGVVIMISMAFIYAPVVISDVPIIIQTLKRL